MKLESITASELSRQMPQLTESLQQGDVRYRIIRNSQYVGMLVGMKDPAIKILEIEACPSDLQRLEFQFRISLSEAWRKTFMEKNGGIVPADGYHWIDRLVGSEGSDLMRELPAKDHCTLWLKNGEPELFTMEVYNLHMDDHKALRDFCLKHDLVYWTEKRSWYLPGVSTLIVIRRNNKRKGA